MSNELTAMQTTPMQLLAVAVQGGADIDKLTKLMDLQERWEANEARKAFVVAMAKFKETPPVILKDKQVAFGKTAYKHAELAQVSAAICKCLSAVGISHRFEVDQADRGISVTCVLTHVMGHSERVTLKAPSDDSGGKNAIQGIASTVTYLERYTLLAATGVATGDVPDDDGASFGTDVQRISDDQLSQIYDLIAESGADEKKLCAHFKIQTVETLPSACFQDVITLLTRKLNHKRDAV